MVEWRREVLPISHLSVRLVVVVILQKSICMLYNNISHLSIRGELKGRTSAHLDAASRVDKE